MAQRSLTMSDAVAALRRAAAELGVGTDAVTYRQLVQAGVSTRQIPRLGGMGAIRAAAREGAAEPEEAPEPPPDPECTERDLRPLLEEVRRGARVYVITWAQNATPVHERFLAALELYCWERGAELLVVPGRYRNPTSQWTQAQADHDWWDEAVTPYLQARRARICDNLALFADMRIQPTAVRPLSGFEVFAGADSAIFGHPKLQLRMVPSAKKEHPRLQTTTGAVTVPNYTDTKAGKKGEAHHVLGACVVEVDGSDGREIFHVRQINADAEGEFTDLDRVYSADGVRQAPPPAALVTGDTHAIAMDPLVQAATYDDEESIVRALRPERVYLHDVLDFRPRNHHTRGNPDVRFAQHHGEGEDNVEAEVVDTVRWIDRIPECSDPYVVASNHDEAFDRWLREADPRTDPENALFWYEIQAERHRDFLERREWTPAFELAYRLRGEGRAVFLRRDEEHVVAGIDVSHHGDKGVNGARGSVLAFSRLGAKTVTGHGHSAEIMDGAYRVGVSAVKRQGYNVGPSTWSHTHCLIYASGKRTLVFVQPNGRWRL